jgi:anaerobic selenocysteine-containing dehydrogenase
VFVADPRRVKGWVHEQVLPNGRWRVAPALLVEQLETWAGTEPHALVGIPRRATRRMNSALRDVMRGGTDTEVWINPIDAATIDDGATVRIATATGSITAIARITDDVAPGCVSIPHGLRDQNVSVLLTGAAGTTDALSGMVTQSGFAVDVSAVDVSAVEVSASE